MTELDFDELDKAVNSLMGDKVPVASSNDASSAAPVSSMPAPALPTSTAESLGSSAPSPAASRPTPPAARRGGRFMDVVPTAPRKDASAPVSRQGVTVQPSSAGVQPEQPKPAPVVSVPVEPTTSSTSSSTSAASDWPDPLELAASKGSDANSNPLETSIADSPKSTPPVVADKDDEGSPESENVSTEEPLSSPFLADAKVEKRPLGGAALASTGSELMVEDENAQLPALPKDVEPALPQELHGDIVSIAADNSTTDPSKHLASEPTEIEKPVKKDSEPAKKPEVTVTEAIAPTGPTSIPQQYKEEPNSGDQKSGAIYDTDSYHQPLTHPAKKKSGWEWVLWILAILVVGAGGGAALYFLGIF